MRNMPVLNLTFEAIEHPSRLALSQLENVMLWPSPSQEQTREEAFAVASIEDYLQRWPIDREEIGRDDLAWIRSLRTLRDLQEHAKKRFLHGFVGGYRLCL